MSEHAIREYLKTLGTNSDTPVGVSSSSNVYYAQWTATSSNANNVKVTDSITLPAGTYIGFIKVPVCSQTTALAFGLYPQPEDMSRSAFFSVGQSVASFPFTLTSPTTVYVITNMSNATTYTYTGRGYFKAVRIA